MKKIIFLVAIMAILTTACGEHEERSNSNSNSSDNIIVETIEVETIEVETIIH